MSKENQRELEEIYRLMNEEFSNNLENQYRELAKVKAESEQIEEMANVMAKDRFCEPNEYQINLFIRPSNALYNAGYCNQSDNVIKFPCNIGDSCYPLPRSRKPIVERKVSRITFTKRNVIIGYYENDGQYRPPLRTRTLGEDVFLTKEEAEKALKGR